MTDGRKSDYGTVAERACGGNVTLENISKVMSSLASAKRKLKADLKARKNQRCRFRVKPNGRYVYARVVKYLSGLDSFKIATVYGEEMYCHRRELEFLEGDDDAIDKGKQEEGEQEEGK